MAETGSHPRHRRSLLHYRAERLLRRDFAGLRAVVLARVRTRLSVSGGRLDECDLEGCYSQAWHAMYQAMLAGERIEEPGAWLALATFRRAVDELRARGRQRALAGAYQRVTAAPIAGGAATGGGAGMAGGVRAADGDMASAIDDRDRVLRLLEDLLLRMGPRERRAVTLCYLHGLTRAEAAQEMGLSERRMRKLMDGTPERPGVAAQMGAVLSAAGADRWCERHGSLMRAYALGVHTPGGERHRLAQAHARDCPRCRALVLCLRGLAVLLPPLPLPLPLRLSPSSRRPFRRRVPGRRSSGRRPRRTSGVPHVRAMLPKLALAGVVALGIGAQRAPLAGRARAPVAATAAAQALRPAPTALTPGRTGVRPRQTHRHPSGGVRRPPHLSPPHAGSTASTPGGSPPRTARSPTAQPPAAQSTAAQPPAPQPGAGPSSAPAPQGEFTPEQPRRR